MSEYRRFAYISSVAFVSIVVLVTTSSPSIEFVGSIFLYFVLLAVFILFGLLAIFRYLNIFSTVRSRFYALWLTSFLVLLQLLATFRALRIVETSLLALTFLVAGWFMSRRNSK